MKPDRRFFDAVVRQLGTDADHCIVIGDDFGVDIVGAHNAGMRQVFYNHAGFDLAKAPFAPTWTVGSLHEVALLPFVAETA